MRPAPRPAPSYAARLVVLATALVSALVPLALPGPAAAAPLGRQSLLTLAEAETVYPQLRGRHDDGHRSVYAFGIDAPDFTTSPLHCDRYRSYRGTSRAQGYYYSLSGPAFAFTETLVRMRTTAEARAVLSHYRAFVRACSGTHATTDGEGGKATMKVRGWEPPRVGDERVGLLDAFIQYGDTTWRRTLLTRVGRTVLELVVEPRRGTGSATRAVEAAELALDKLG
ncbi:MAG TPA: hypothetical protein VFV89_02375 [Nocardioides sp.]|uniref:hypothetical protein n=1 Tax=Nocardioides sp. TaxID=35761 RepID=UPI002E311CBF|nr:hypothetical protein [Nocardioides sp.]HEX5086623.1 hypothetical protein [Nocardioides sp.]